MSRGPDVSNGSRMDPLEVQVGREEMFVSYTPSPRNAMEHLQRRNSTSATCSMRGAESAIGNAKKVTVYIVFVSSNVQLRVCMFTLVNIS